MVWTSRRGAPALEIFLTIGFIKQNGHSCIRSGAAGWERGQAGIDGVMTDGKYCPWTAICAPRAATAGALAGTSRVPKSRTWQTNTLGMPN